MENTMLKISSILCLSATALMLSACGGSGSDTSFSSFSSTKSFRNFTYVCTTRASADACTSDNTCAAQSACTRQGGTSNTPVAACSVSGNNVTVPNNSRCAYSNAFINGGAAVTYSCNNGTLTGANGFTSSMGININGTQISCSN